MAKSAADPGLSMAGTTSLSSVSSEVSAIQSNDGHDRCPLSASSRGYYYLSPQAVKKLPEYQYQGADLSPIYKHFLSPLAAWCVDHLTPTWLAPNSITLLGLMWMILSYCVIWYWAPGLYEANTDVNAAYAVPGVVFLLNGCAMLIYQTLDNMDGKQARKTGSSSPLGLLFDHGCDAVNMIFGSGNWIAAMAMVPGNVEILLGEDNENIQNKSIVCELFGGDAMMACMLVLCPMVAFYVSTWEQYYTGKLILPPFNGPTEGLLLGATLSIVSFLYGSMFWQSTSLVDAAIAKLSPQLGQESFIAGLDGCVRNMDLIVVASVVGLVQEVTLKAVFVTRTYGLQALRTLVPNALLSLSTMAIVRMDPSILLRIPRTMLHLTSGLFVEQVTQLMLDHMVEENFEVRRRFVMIPQVGIAVMMMMEGMHISTQALDTFFLVYTTGLWVYLTFKVRLQVYEICDVLGIYCFDIVTPKSKTDMNANEILGTTIPARRSASSESKKVK